MNVFRVSVCKDCGFRSYTEEVELEPDEAREYMAAITRNNRKKYRK